MSRVVIAFPGNEALSDQICQVLNLGRAEILIRSFPDGESYVRLLTSVSGKEVIVIATLDRPDPKILSLLFLLKLVKDSHAKRIVLIAPYLAYMRQDKQFQAGEAITSTYFATLISAYADELITIDPHLHRRKSLGEIYAIPTRVLHATALISDQIKQFVKDPLVIGPDQESEQWVSVVAKDANAPYLVLKKHRYGDRAIQVELPELSAYRHCTPVLVDDVISTARTMIEIIAQLKKEEMASPVCIGVHGIFSGDAYEELRRAGAKEIVTSNAIPHQSNQIDIVPLITEALRTDD